MQEERIKRFVYILLLSNIAITAFHPLVKNTTIKIILTVYTMLTLLLVTIYVKDTKKRC